MAYEFLYEFNGQKVTLDDLKPLIINDFVDTEMTKFEIYKKYPASQEKICIILKGLQKKRKCKQCGETDESLFYPKDRVMCKNCVLKIAKNKYSNFSDEEKLNYITNQKKWVKTNIIRNRVMAAKHRAKQKNLEFDIDENFILKLFDRQNGCCAYSGLELNLKGDDNSFSIERIDSNLGYLKNNVVLVSIEVNRMKNSLPLINFFSLVKLIYEKNFK